MGPQHPCTAYRCHIASLRVPICTSPGSTPARPTPGCDDSGTQARCELQVLCCSSGDGEKARAGLPTRGPAARLPVRDSPRLRGAPRRSHHPFAEGQMLFLEDAPSPPQRQGYKARVLPQSQVWQGLCQAEEEEAAKGAGLAGPGGTVAGMGIASSCQHGARAASPTVISACRRSRWVRRRGSLRPVPRGWEQTLKPVAAWAAHPPPPDLQLRGVPRAARCRLPNGWAEERALGKASAGACSPVIRVCLTSNVSS